MNNPLVSILIPVYNIEKYLPDCFQSLINQTYNNIEIIFVNDGSTDNSEALIKQYCLKDSRAKLFVQQNKGPSAARNLAIANSKGELIYFYDADDILHPKVIETFVLKIQNFDLIASNFNYINEKQKYSNVKYKDCTKKISYKSFDNKDDIYSIFLKKFKSCFSRTIWNKLYRRSILVDLENYPNIYNTNISLGEDCNFLAKYLAKCKNIKCLKQKLYFYRKRKNSLMRNSFKVGYIGLIKCLNSLNTLNFENLPKTFAYLNSLNVIHSFIVLFKLFASKDIKAQIKYYDDIVTFYKKYKKLCFKSRCVNLKIAALLTMPCFSLISSLIKHRLKKYKSQNIK